MSSNTIKTIAVVPRNARYAQYYINDGEQHTAKYDEMEEIIKEILPTRMSQVQELLTRFTPFIIFVEEELIRELVFDEAEELKNYQQQFFERQFAWPMKHSASQINEYYSKKENKTNYPGDVSNSKLKDLTQKANNIKKH